MTSKIFTTAEGLRQGAALTPILFVWKKLNIRHRKLEGLAERNSNELQKNCEV